MMKLSDLAFRAGKNRLSPRTGLIHGAGLLADTVLIYDNFCYAYALLAQRKATEIQEAKTLLLRLLAFQAPDGVFPIHLHDYPRCYDQYMGLKVAPLLLRSLQGYGPVIGAECKEKLEASIQAILAFYKDKQLSPLWAYRYQVCLGQKPEPISVARSDTWEHWISLQFLQIPTCDFYHEGLSLAPSLLTPQEGFEPAPHLIEWACAIAAGTSSPRLQKDHPSQLHLAALEKVELTNKQTATSLQVAPFKLYWKDQFLHSLVLAAENPKVTPRDITIDLPEAFEFTRDDLFEVAFFVDASPEVKIELATGRGTAFMLGEPIQISTPNFKCILQFDLASGEGDFCGRIFRSNRPGQIAATGELQYEAYDWKIALRTLRRSPKCSIRISY